MVRQPPSPAESAKMAAKMLEVSTKVFYAVKTGAMKKEPCKVCGGTDVEAHHDDYDKPLGVVWLCTVCHKNLHTIRRRGHDVRVEDLEPPQNIEIGKHGFFVPLPNSARVGKWFPISFGVFEWVPGRLPGSIKRGPCKVTVYGYGGCEELMALKAKDIAARLDVGTYSGRKSVRVPLHEQGKG